MSIVTAHSESMRAAIASHRGALDEILGRVNPGLILDIVNHQFAQLADELTNR